MKEVQLKIEGMSCGHCVRAVETALKGVEQAVVHRVELGSAQLAIPESVEVGALIDALADAGYSAEERA
jgi:copper chaperone